MRSNASMKDVGSARSSRLVHPLTIGQFSNNPVEESETSEPRSSASRAAKQEEQRPTMQRSLTMPRIPYSQSSNNLIIALHRQSSVANIHSRTVVLKRQEPVEEPPPQKTPREVNKFASFQPRVIKTRPSLLNFRNIVFEAYDARFSQLMKPQRIIELFTKLKRESKPEPYKMHNWQAFELQIADGVIAGCDGKDESDRVRQILDEESINHIKLFGHDEYYRYYMWLKFENNNDYFNYYAGEMTAVQWQIQTVQDTIGVCYLQQLK